ncbi:T9SS type A sorting domain-containing protein [Flavobacterium aciduliphilum]|uniref:Putative secreted protein (Por secretion system target) n=1 Tax=Flavobacterium aciduliphilum TaxID=1101402 RepID=A0A328YQT4_9FLAO|nr:T9SS type A sorting domain-containing protein [Flavobacterium aciduliphilum]RAR75724.1 putative secreted protein (Por secretion system target) [Flavobacterium aciduliphilum]
MKKILLYFKIALLLVTTSSTAQTYYSHYLDGTSEWRYFRLDPPDPNLNYYGKFYRTIFFDGTEDYDGYTYYREKMFTVIKYYDQSTDQLLQTDEYYPTTYNLVREDAQGRFYHRGYTDYTIEEMYQDNSPIQNSQVGDTFPSLPDFNFGACPVVTIEQLSIAGLNLKKLMGNNGPHGGLVEGVGVLGQACNGGGNDLVCYTKQGESLIFEPGTDCSIFPIPVRLATETFLNKPISIYPNPTIGIINIDSNDNIEQLELYNYQGKKLQLLKNTKAIDLSNYPQGIYLLKIQTEAGLQTKCVIKN